MKSADYKAVVNCAAQFENLVSNIPGVAYRSLTGNECTILYISDEITRLTGYAVSDFINNAVRSYYDIIHPEDREIVKQEISRALAAGKSFEIEYRLITNDHRVIYVYEKGKGVYYAPDKNRYTEGVVIDITPRKITERQLFDSEAKFRQIMDNISDVVFHSDFNFKATYLSPSAEKMSGEPVHQSIKRDITEIFTPESVEMMNKLFAEEMQKEHDPNVPKQRTAQLEAQFIRRNQQLVDVSVTYTFLRDERGVPVAIQGVLRDVTEQKKSRQQLKAAVEELERYFNSSLDMLCIANMQGYFIRLNPEWENILGYSVGELTGMRFLDLIHPDDVQPTINTIGELEKQKEVLSFENRYRCKDGSYRWIEWRSKPLGNLIYAVARDVTERKKAEDTLRFQSSYQQLTASIAGSFVTAGKKDLENVIQEALLKVSTFFGIDCSCLFRYIQEDDALLLENQWTASGVEPVTEILKVLAADSYPWIKDKLERLPFVCEDIENLPREASCEKEIGKATGAKTWLLYPMRVENTCLGLMSFTNTRERKEWSQEQILLLGVIIKIISEAIYRIRMEEKVLEAEKMSTAMALVVTANHELNQPLMIIQGYIDLLRVKNSITPDLVRYLEGIQQALERISSIIHSLDNLQNIVLTDYVEGSKMLKLPDDK